MQTVSSLFPDFLSIQADRLRVRGICITLDQDQSLSVTLTTNILLKTFHPALFLETSPS